MTGVENDWSYMEHSVMTFDDFIRMDFADIRRRLGNNLPQVGDLGEEVLAHLASNLCTMDEAHAVFAIEILGRHSPRLLLPPMVNLLSDSRISVWTAASRILLNYMPKDAVTSDMLEQYISSLSSHVGFDKESFSIKKLRERFRSNHSSKSEEEFTGD